MDRPNEVFFEEGYRETTNNRMELLACIRALEYVRHHVPALRISRVIIVTDSLYLHNHYRHAPLWKKQGWMGGQLRILIFGTI